MGHLNELELNLRERIAHGDVEALVKWVKDQVLKSYRNGLATRTAAGKAGEQVARSAAKKS